MISPLDVQAGSSWLLPTGHVIEVVSVEYGMIVHYRWRGSKQPKEVVGLDMFVAEAERRGAMRLP